MPNNALVFERKWKAVDREKHSFGCKARPLLQKPRPTGTNNFNKNTLVKKFFVVQLLLFWVMRKSINYFVWVSEERGERETFPSIQFTNYTSFIKHFYVFLAIVWMKSGFASILSFGNLFMMKAFSSHPRRLYLLNLKTFSINFYVYVHIWNTFGAILRLVSSMKSVSVDMTYFDLSLWQ